MVGRGPVNRGVGQQKGNDPEHEEDEEVSKVRLREHPGPSGKARGIPGRADRHHRIQPAPSADACVPEVWLRRGVLHQSTDREAVGVPNKTHAADREDAAADARVMLQHCFPTFPSGLLSRAGTRK